MIMKFGVFIQKAFSEPNGTPSSKRLITVYATIIYSIILTSSFFFGFPINEAVLHMADVFLGTAAGSYVVSRFSEKGAPVQPDEEVEPNKSTK